MGQEALESSSTVLQTVAKPSQLLTHQEWERLERKKPDVDSVTSGFAFVYAMVGQMSQAQGVWQSTRRFIGGVIDTTLFTYETCLQNHHRSEFQCRWFSVS